MVSFNVITQTLVNVFLEEYESIFKDNKYSKRGFKKAELRNAIENNTFKLKPNCSMLIENKNPIVTIKSNCLFLRPTVFSYKGKYLDVHHS